MRLLGVERENLERHLAVRHEQRDDGPYAQLLERLQAMVAVWREIRFVAADDDDRIEEAADFLDDGHQPLDVRIGRIALVRCRLDAIQGKRNEEQRLAAERIVVRGEHCAVIGLDLRRQSFDLGAACLLRFSGRQPDG